MTTLSPTPGGGPKLETPDWPTVKLRRLASVVTTKATDKTFELGLEDIESWTGRLVSGESTYEAAGVAFEKDDVLFGKLRPYLAKAYQAEQQGQAVGDFIVLRPSRNSHPKFLTYNLLEQRLIDRITAGAYGSKMPRTNWDDLGSQPILLLPYEEQCRIAAFLDYETARIDKLVREQERLLSLLGARETARITEVVTRGLNDGVELRESGQQALGDIPVHWEVIRLKHLLRAPLTYGANEASVEDDPTFPRYIRITDIDGHGNLRDETFRSLAWEVAAPYLLEDGDLLLARSGATVGKSFLYRDRVGPACFAGYMIRAKLDPSKLLPEYAEAYMKSRPYWDYIQESNIQATIQNVSAEKYGNCPVPVPPLEEQIAILGELADESKSSRELHAQASRSISYLLERRSALISAAVTGKLDLRNWQPPESEAVAEVA